MHLTFGETTLGHHPCPSGSCLFPQSCRYYPGYWDYKGGCLVSLFPEQVGEKPWVGEELENQQGLGGQES